MLSICQSAMGLLVGLTLYVYGFVHTFTRYPGPEPITHWPETCRDEYGMPDSAGWAGGHR